MRRIGAERLIKWIQKSQNSTSWEITRWKRSVLENVAS